LEEEEGEEIAEEVESDDASQPDSDYRASSKGPPPKLQPEDDGGRFEGNQHTH